MGGATYCAVVLRVVLLESHTPKPDISQCPQMCQRKASAKTKGVPREFLPKINRVDKGFNFPHDQTLRLQT